MSDLLVSMTFRIAMSPITGAEIVVTRRRIEAMKRKVTPTLVEHQQKVDRCRAKSAQ